MPRPPLSKIAQGAHEVDKCPVKGCTYIYEHYETFVAHMRDVHGEDVRDGGEQ